MRKILAIRLARTIYYIYRYISPIVNIDIARPSSSASHRINDGADRVALRVESSAHSTRLEPSRPSVRGNNMYLSPNTPFLFPPFFSGNHSTLHSPFSRLIRREMSVKSRYMVRMDGGSKLRMHKNLYIHLFRSLRSAGCAHRTGLVLGCCRALASPSLGSSPLPAANIWGKKKEKQPKVSRQ